MGYVAEQFRALGEGMYTYDAHDKKQVRGILFGMLTIHVYILYRFWPEVIC